MHGTRIACNTTHRLAYTCIVAQTFAYTLTHAHAGTHTRTQTYTLTAHTDAARSFERIQIVARRIYRTPTGGHSLLHSKRKKSHALPCILLSSIRVVRRRFVCIRTLGIRAFCRSTARGVRGERTTAAWRRVANCEGTLFSVNTM